MNVSVFGVKRCEGNYQRKIEKWMELKRKRKIYELGSLPSFLVVFDSDVEPVDHKWNQHDLDGDNVKGSCRSLYPCPISLLHWSSQGTSQVRFNEKRLCPLDHLWELYDLYKPNRDRLRHNPSSHHLSLVLSGSSSIEYSSYSI